jgi:excinuclease ABC subunit C
MPGSKTKPEYSNLPELSGIYRFYNSQEQLIYVGKAKNIKKRVSSYFNKTGIYNRKTQKLVSEITRIDYAIANTEFDALLLENNFIKQYQPKYNILLKDDKTFPYLCILNERFPRIISTRTFTAGTGEYFGPFSSVHAMKSMLELLRKLYKIRTCNYQLSELNITNKKFKTCLEFHIGNCLGPCVGLQKEKEYQDEIEQARNIIKGNVSLVKDHYQQNMKFFADNLDFEKAQYYKDKLELLDKFQSKSIVVNKSLTDIDVFSITSNDEYAFVNFLRIKEGAIIFSKNYEIKKKLEETDQEILTIAVIEIRNKIESNHKLILSNLALESTEDGVVNLVPQIGDKKKLVLLSLKNAIQLRQQKENSSDSKANKSHEAVVTLKKDLRLAHLPMVIECFDNSNLQGSTPVASMVQFVNAKPNKKNYRHFNINTVDGPNDFASMREIVSRRYTKLINDSLPLPDLIVVDGGKGQLSSAVEALKDLNIYGQIPIIGIAKRLEEIYFPEDSIPLHLGKKSLSLFLLQKLRDEAHRFAINFHRNKRSKASINSGISKIEGIGENTQKKLLQNFKSWKRIESLSIEELVPVIGKSKAALIFRAIKKGT